jgi:Bacteroidetes VLRF1 release factor
MRVLLHCRYVTRAGQGGRQSTQDRTGKVAHSAGSSLRRYNESALAADIANTLSSWGTTLTSADLIFIHAQGANAGPVFEGLAAAGKGNKAVGTCMQSVSEEGGALEVRTDVALSQRDA